MHDHAVQAATLLLPLVAPPHPRLHFGVLVGAVVVRNDVQRQILGGFAVELLQKRQPLPMRVCRCSLTEDLPVQIG